MNAPVTTLTGVLIDTPRFSNPARHQPHRPAVRTSFRIKGKFSGRQNLLAASDALATEIVGTLKAGDTITCTCLPKQKRGGQRVLHVESFTLHRRGSA